VLLPSGYEFTFGSATAYFPEGKAGKLVGKANLDADVSKAKASADGLFRVWATNMADPAAFPMFRRLSAQRREARPSSRSGTRARTSC
jgi:hypothetical protein